MRGPFSSAVLFASLLVLVSAQVDDSELLPADLFDGPVAIEGGPLDDAEFLGADVFDEPLTIEEDSLADELLKANVTKRAMTIEEYMRDVVRLPLEKHYTRTEDGYILALHRIPNEGKPPILLQHGLLDSAWSWIYNTPDVAIAPRLHALGYDVWMGNNRGNVYSRNHTALFPDSRLDRQQFFAFTWQDMARFDVPALVDYVLLKTGYTNLVYVGHSRGTIQFFSNVLPLENACHSTISSEQKDSPNLLRANDASSHRYIAPPSSVASKVKLFVALAPVAHLSHTRSQLLRLLVDVKLADAVSNLGVQEFLRDSQAVHTTAQLACRLTFNKVCELGIKAIAQVSVKQDNMTLYDTMFSHFPAGTSVRDMKHFAQLVASPSFSAFDFGGPMNVKEYRPFACRKPPSFAVDQWPKDLPLALFSGSDDSLAAPGDVALLRAALPKESVVYDREFAEFGHFTFLGQKRSASWWLDDLFGIVSKYTPDKHVGGGNANPPTESSLSGAQKPADVVVM